ncbi:MAG TPA: cytochrome c peroxidase [Albidovulum sp.]|uniref:cytochrome-c peroxidase n=1 Tax=Albidovulum sp. TaxID=1872424 RepID=UPI002B8141D5|nr:cytochrome c peroxidase [Albidovulum sp.]
MKLAAASFAAVLAASATVAAELDPVESLGKSLFFDADLSVNGNQSCSSCHEPAQGFSSPMSEINAAGSVIEGSVPGRFGNRKPPTMAYASFSPVLSHIIDDGDVTFVGGAFLDGRATGGKLGMPIADQAQGPFLNPAEMAMPSSACVVYRVLHPEDPSKFPVTLADVWGKDVADVTFPEGIDEACKNPDAKIEIPEGEMADRIETAFGRIALSIAAFEQSQEVNRFSSRYDKWTRGEATLTEEELAGLKVFEAEDKGNCAACHVLTPNTQGGPAVLTDWTFDNLGVPKNRDNPFYQQAANTAGKDWFDPGLGGYLETDPVFAPYAKANMARQQVPTLRNLTKRTSADTAKGFMHNGYFKTLEGIVSFYNTRDVRPACADPIASEAEAMAQKCWPAPEYAETMNKDELGNLKMTAEEEADLVAFLKTFDDE